MWNKIKEWLHTHLFTCEIKVKCNRPGKDVDILKYNELPEGVVLVGVKKEADEDGVFQGIQVSEIDGSMCRVAKTYTTHSSYLSGGLWAHKYETATSTTQVHKGDLLGYRFDEVKVPDFDEWYEDLVKKEEGGYPSLEMTVSLSNPKILTKMVRAYIPNKDRHLAGDVVKEGDPSDILENYIEYMLEDVAKCKVHHIVKRKEVGMTSEYYSVYFTEGEDTDSTVLSYCRKEMGWLV